VTAADVTVALDTATFARLEERDRLVLASCATPVDYERDEYLFSEGEEAETFFVIREGEVALDLHVPRRGRVTLETLRPGEVVGWAWLFPPRLWHFDARCLTRVHALAFDADCVRARIAADDRFGAAVMACFAEIVVDRLDATRLRLLESDDGSAG
jgi:CRP-like cAMP-binding protein